MHHIKEISCHLCHDKSSEEQRNHFAERENHISGNVRASLSNAAK